MAQQVGVTYELFVSHAPAEAGWVHGVLLTALGVPPEAVITPSGFEPGRSIVAEFERAITTSRFTVLVLTPAYLLDPWSIFGDQLVSYARMAGLGNRMIPLLLEECTLPLHIDALVRLDCTERESCDDGLKWLRGALQRPEVAVEEIPCPYPGLDPYTEQDAERFYGREAAVVDAVERLASYPFLAVIGSSGSGKSSFLSAGVLPALKRSRRFPGGEWRFLRLRPGAEPVARVAAVLSEHLPRASEDLAGELSRDTGSLGRLMAQIAAGGDGLTYCLLCVDQFEELFAQCKDVEQRQLFLNHLHALLEEPPARCLLVLAVRSDFFGDCQESVLGPFISARFQDLLPLSGDELRAAIVKPARQAGVLVEPALVERLIADASGEGSVLPLLQETLVLLWTQSLQQRLLRLRDYEALGNGGRTGLQVALARRADGVLAALGTGQRQEIARRILVRLIEFGDRRNNTRRQQPPDALHTDADPEALFDEVLEHLVDHRLLTTSTDLHGGGPMVDLAHEALIDAWPQLANWVEAYHAMEETRRSLVLAMTAWDGSGRDPSYLFSGTRLRAVQEWTTKWPDEVGQMGKAFLAESHVHEKRQRRRQGMGWGAMSIVAVVVAAMLFNWGQHAWVRGNTGTSMVSIAGGSAIIGTNDLDAERGEQRARSVDLAPFQIEKHEVTVAQYRACVHVGPCGEPGVPDWLPDPERNKQWFEDESWDRYPIVSVTANQAHQYCDWLGRRLPTAVEWERAARGAGGRRWPWGDDPTPSEEYEFPEEIVPVDAETETATLDDGILHLADNVAEWVASVPSSCQGAACQQPWDGGRDEVAIMGGASDLPIDRITQISLYSPDSPEPNVGFRCALSE